MFIPMIHYNFICVFFDLCISIITYPLHTYTREENVPATQNVCYWLVGRWVGVGGSMRGCVGPCVGAWVGGLVVGERKYKGGLLGGLGIGAAFGAKRFQCTVL